MDERLTELRCLGKPSCEVQILTRTYASLAQSEEQLAVNQWVAGSSPAGSAIHAVVSELV